MFLLIMTRGRVGKQRTLESIPTAWLDRTMLVAPIKELGRHFHTTFGVPDWVDNYSKKFQYIIDGNVVDDNKVVILDDDLVFSKRVGDKLLKVRDKEELNEMFELMDELLDTTALVGVHPRQMGHTKPTPYVENGKVICIQGVNRELCAPMPRVDRFPILADVILNCTLLSRGIGNKLITSFVQDWGSCQAPGGCSLYRTPEMQKEAVEWVAKEFAPYAKAVVKKPKQAKWLGDERVDLTVQWKRMYMNGVENANR